ncbi:exocyst complex component EXO84C-like [Phragmites australis]|uniref:exocyst complex component EXO84C-like n=1 Tax=Phragmites australis TaxID=29695 RepID=UPI002D783909|nr:exocyst complex component EXO84C-like [Phragmites australis]
MESSSEEELEEDFPGHEWITPQSSIRAAYQSQTEKGIRKICSELLELKDAIENLCGNMQSKYLAFLRISEEVVEAEQELIELQKHVSAQGILVQDLMSGVCRELDIWHKSSKDEDVTEKDFQTELDEILSDDTQDPNVIFLDKIDVLLAEYKIEEALLALEAEEKKYLITDESSKESNADISAFKIALFRRKSILEDQLVRYSEQPSLSITELRKSLSGLIRIGKSSLAHQVLLRAYGLRLQKSVEAFLPNCSIYTETYSATLSHIVFSAISKASKETTTLLGDSPMNTNRIIQWAEYEIETFARLVKENSPLPESVSALRSACICIQTSLSHCSYLESHGLKLSKLLMILLRPYIEEVLDLNFRRVRRKIVDSARNDDILLITPQEGSPLSGTVAPNIMLTSSGKKFMSIVNDVLDQVTPMTIVHFGGTILNKFLQLFDRYVETLIKVLPGPSEDDNLVESNEPVEFKAESDAQKLTLIGTAYTVADELLPAAVSKFFDVQTEKKGTGGSSEGLGSGSIYSMEYKEWKHHLQHSLDKLRDHFCRQYVLSFIYLEGKSRLDARMYLERKSDDLLFDSDPLPSLPFQALFGRLQQLASVAGDVLLGKEKTQKVLLSRLTETVVMWLSNEQEFWDVFEDQSVQLQPSGLQQLILDMHFIVEIAVCGRFPHRPVQQLVSAVITKAIAAFSARDVDPQSALPEDEWFLDTAKAAIHKLMLGTSGSESEPQEHVAQHDEISDSEESTSTLSTIGSEDSFASANNDDLESPAYFIDPET